MVTASVRTIEDVLGLPAQDLNECLAAPAVRPCPLTPGLAGERG